MFDSHRTLVNMLISGLIGLMVGLFIGWWVWPVEWNETPNTVTQLPQTAPAQSAAPLVEGDEGPPTTYSNYLDWVNRGLLILAAALLLIGGVVIGYQLLRQPEEPPVEDQSAPPAPATGRPVTAAAPPRWRTSSAHPSARPTRPRPASVNATQRERLSHDDLEIDEPVFPEQPGFDGWPAPDGDAVERRSPLSEEDPLGADSWSVAEEDWAELPPDADFDSERATPKPPAPGIRKPAPSDARVSRIVHSVAWDRAPVETALEDHPPHEDAADDEPEYAGEESEWAEEVQPEVSAAEDELAGEKEDAGAAEPSPYAADSAALADGSETSSPDQPAGDALAALPAETESAAAAQESLPQPTGRWMEQIPEGETPLTAVGAFEASYAFGIQSYDESFTINAADDELLGACGMGLNESLDTAAADTDEVRLLDIWLYDRSAVSSVSQALVPPGFDTSALDDRTDNDGSVQNAPLEVATGLTCTLRSKQLTLECTVTEVTYLDSEQAPRPFRSLKASLVVHSRTAAFSG
jgi:hypothetical protein